MIPDNIGYHTSKLASGPILEKNTIVVYQYSSSSGSKLEFLQTSLFILTGFWSAFYWNI
jgi:hypothetical protein